MHLYICVSIYVREARDSLVASTAAIQNTLTAAYTPESPDDGLPWSFIAGVLFT